MITNVNFGFLRTFKNGFENYFNNIKRLANQELENAPQDDMTSMMDLDVDFEEEFNKIRKPLKLTGFEWLSAFFDDVIDLASYPQKPHFLKLYINICEVSDFYIKDVLNNNIDYSEQILSLWLQVRDIFKRENDIDKLFIPFYKTSKNLDYHMIKGDINVFVNQITEKYDNGTDLIFNQKSPAGILKCKEAINDLHSINYKKGYYPLWVAVLGYLSLLENKFANQQEIDPSQDIFKPMNKLGFEIRKFSSGKKVSNKSLKTFLLPLLHEAPLPDTEDFSFVDEFFHLSHFKKMFNRAKNPETAKVSKKEAADLIDNMQNLVVKLNKIENINQYSEYNVQLRTVKSLFKDEPEKNLFNALLDLGATVSSSDNELSSDMVEELAAGLDLLDRFLHNNFNKSTEKAMSAVTQRMNLMIEDKTEEAKKISIPSFQEKVDPSINVINVCVERLEIVLSSIDKVLSDNGDTRDLAEIPKILKSTETPLKFIGLDKAFLTVEYIRKEFSRLVNFKDNKSHFEDETKENEIQDILNAIPTLILYLQDYINNNQKESSLNAILNIDEEKEDEQKIELDKALQGINIHKGDWEKDYDDDEDKVSQDKTSEDEVILIDREASEKQHVGEQFNEDTSSKTSDSSGDGFSDDAVEQIIDTEEDISSEESDEITEDEDTTASKQISKNEDLYDALNDLPYDTEEIDNNSEDAKQVTDIIEDTSEIEDNKNISSDETEEISEEQAINEENEKSSTEVSENREVEDEMSEIEDDEKTSGVELEEVPEKIDDEETSSIEKVSEEVVANENTPVDEVSEELPDTTSEDIVTEDEVSENIPAKQEVQDGMVGYDNIESVEEMDEELAEIFIEEVNEKIEEINEVLETYNIADEDYLEQNITIKRAFHTIKGSGRTVGFVHIGDAAMIVEDYMKGVLNDERLLTNAEKAFLASASNQFNIWIGALERQETIAIVHRLHKEIEEIEDEQDQFNEEFDVIEDEKAEDVQGHDEEIDREADYDDEIASQENKEDLVEIPESHDDVAEEPSENDEDISSSELEKTTETSESLENKEMGDDGYSDNEDDLNNQIEPDVLVEMDESSKQDTNIKSDPEQHLNDESYTKIISALNVISEQMKILQEEFEKMGKNE